jgi:pimeloyl-ACP methyl ester carboxylesterase
MKGIGVTFDTIGTCPIATILPSLTRRSPISRGSMTTCWAKLVQNGTLKTYHGFPHGVPTTQADTINADLLAFIKA